jgi:hypothetical protein
MCVLSRGVFVVIDTADDWIRKYGKIAPAFFNSEWEVFGKTHNNFSELNVEFIQIRCQYGCSLPVPFTT